MEDIINIGIGSAIDIVIGHSDFEHIEDLMVFNKDWQKFSPQFGAEAGKYTHSNDCDLKRLATEVERNIEADNLKNRNVQLIDKKLLVNGNY